MVNLGSGSQGTSITLVCRGSLEDGLGHVMRAASIAVALAEVGATVIVVLIGDASAAKVLADLDVAHHRVASDAEAAALVEAHRPALVVFDTLAIEEEAFRRMQAGRRTASTSPIFAHQAEVDASFSRASDEPDPKLRALPDLHRRGLEYTVVGLHARAIDHAKYVDGLYRDPLNIGISMGGADAANRTLTVLAEILETARPLLLWVMLGEGYAHSYEDLVAAVRRDRRHEVILARTTRSMWTVLDRCSLLILAGGVTTYEAAYAGMPSINLLDSESERFLLRDLEDAGAVSAIERSGAWGDALREELAAAVEDRDRLFLMHRRCGQLIDGRGASRIARELMVVAATSR